MSIDLSKVYRFTMTDYQNWENGIYVCRQRVQEGVALHWHDHYEIEYIVEGSGRQIFNEQEYQIRPGALHLLMPTDFHELFATSTLKIIKINYRESDVDPFVLNTLIGLSNNAPLYFDGEERELLEAAFMLIAQHAKYCRDSSYYSLASKKLLECIILDIIDHLKRHGNSEQSVTAGENGDIQRVLAYIHQNFKKPLDLKTVAEVAHYSPQHLSKMFHQAMGTTFKGYITNLRMNFASNLILNTDMRITDICSEAGFGTVESFTREFKKFYSYSPSEYRSKGKNSNPELKREVMKAKDKFPGPFW